jgi:hypothetical protein
MQVRGGPARIAIIVPILLLASSAAHAQVNQFTFTRIAETLTDVSAPALDDGQIAFWAIGPDQVRGIYSGPVEGPYVRVIDPSSTVPGTAVPFSRVYQEFGFDSGRIAFYGRSEDTTGIYLFNNGTIQQIADTTSSIPSAMKQFGLFSGQPSIDRGQVVFAAQSDTTSGASLYGTYSWNDGVLSAVADTTTPIPGSTQVFNESFGSPVIDRGRVVFGDRFNQAAGIYLHDIETGVQSRVVDTDTPIPGRMRNFRWLNLTNLGLDLDGDQIAFVGGSPPVLGVYLFDLGSQTLSTIADDQTPVPGAPAFQFTDGAFYSVSIDQQRIAIGYGEVYLSFGISPPDAPGESPFFGVYSNFDGSLQRVLAKGDTLDGKLVQRATMGRQGLDGDRIGIRVDFEDGSSASYIAAPIPEPATLALLLTACCLLPIVFRRMSAVPR